MSIYILEAEIVLGVLYRKGVIPKKGGTLDFRKKGVRSLFFVFGTLLITFGSLFLMLLSLFSSLFGQTPFAGLLLRQGEERQNKFYFKKGEPK